MILSITTRGGVFLYYGRRVSTPCRVLITEEEAKPLTEYCKRNKLKYKIEEGSEDVDHVQRGKRVTKISSKPSIRQSVRM